MICPNCGSNIPDNSAFCSKCGNKIEVQNTGAGSGYQAPPDPYVNTPIDLGTGSVDTGGNKSGNVPVKEPFVWKDQYTYIALIAAVVIAAIVGLIIRLNRNPQGRVSENNYSQEYAQDYAENTETQAVEVQNSEDVYSEYEAGSEYEAADGYEEQAGESVEYASEDNYDYSEEESLNLNAGADVDVESEVSYIRDEYDDTIKMINSGVYERIKTANGEEIYRDGTRIRAIMVPSDASTDGYLKEFFYTYAGDLYFAYYESSDANRLYFAGDSLIRWRYSVNARDAQNAVNYDLENSSEYKNWELNTLREGNYYLSICAAESENYTNTDYILPDSDCTYLSKSDLYGLSAEECRLARNELYARHGRFFDDEGIQAYFNSKDWYTGRIAPSDFEESMLNDYEVYNRDLIVSYEEEMGYR